MAGKEAKDRGRKRKRASSPGDLMMDVMKTLEEADQQRSQPLEEP
jgi:hypothetical protein